MTTADPLIVETCSRLFAELCPPAVVNAAEEGEWPDGLWKAVEEAGLGLAWVPEQHGGADSSLVDGFAIARVAAAHAAPLPLAETLLAGWLLADAGLDCPAGPMTVTIATPHLGTDGQLTGSATRVPFVSSVAHVAAVALIDNAYSECVVLLPATNLAVSPRRNLAGEPEGDVTLTGITPVAVGTCRPGGSNRLAQMGAVMRSQQIAGALGRILDQCIEYARDRQQFGQPIGRFQAVQHNLAMLAGEAAAASSAADAAVKAIERHGLDDPRTQIAVASAKVRAGEAAGTGAAIAHQVHGAMGYTHEYSLHHSTRRLWAWRDDFGSESVWAARLGEQVTAAGSESLWPALSDF